MIKTGEISGKRVLITLDAVGGVWRFTLDLARSLKRGGMIVTLAGFGPAPSEKQAREALAVDKLIWLDAPLDWTTDSRAALDEIPPLLKDIIARERIDILHLNLPSQAAGLETNIPTIAMSHSCVTTWFGTMRGGDLPSDFAWHYDINREGLLRADIIVAPSHSHAMLLKKTYGDIGQVSVVYNASDLHDDAAEKENLILSAGRWWDEGKNGRVLELSAANLRWPFFFAGADEGPRGEHTGLAQGSRLGQLGHDQIVDLMRRAAIFVSPSRYEPFGLAALEAARCGCALLLSDIPTYRELWNGAAVFADPASPEDFLLKLEELISDRQATAELAARSQRRSFDYSEQHQASEMIALYQRALARAQAPAE
ncbi:glycosyltransferase family 4 protein [uncultured Agrobacterium sp.]|uniref:glycosyltransferase family 4 protein n=1 Tax=uncultured Agrobacterium sp. TaxID=157277 RepID=UPI002586F68E|nr:glycosyltransferase family 4 protein [uncultured Agrobacterium sp.]